ncbi:hypothetical protein [Nocardia salmonicida]|uniref:hypothetical protein n=1 Tax=Nocardia salmonicida TaxID=53431 RepID=UPI0033EC242A
MNRMMGRMAVVVFAGVTLVGMGGMAAAAPDTGSGAGSSGSSGSSPGDGIQGRWAGTWSVTSGVYPGTLDVSSEAPFRARIDIPSRPCVAEWTEVARSGNVVTVRATVVSGSCVDNTWRLTVESSVITGSDPDNSRNSVVFRR